VCIRPAVAWECAQVCCRIGIVRNSSGLGSAINTEFPHPLPFTEVIATAQSISRWIWRNFTEEDYRALQSHRGRTMTEKKREANRVRATKYDEAAMRAVLL